MHVIPINAHHHICMLVLTSIQRIDYIDGCSANMDEADEMMKILIGINKKKNFSKKRAYYVVFSTTWCKAP